MEVVSIEGIAGFQQDPGTPKISLGYCLFPRPIALPYSVPSFPGSYSPRCIRDGYEKLQAYIFLPASNLSKRSIFSFPVSPARVLMVNLAIANIPNLRVLEWDQAYPKHRS